MPLRAVIDTSSLVSSRYRRDLQQAAQLGAFTAIRSPWIIAELNRVLVWRWIRGASPEETLNNLLRASERHCSEQAKQMMQILLPSFELVAPLPPYPPAWETLADVWDHPIWAAAKIGRADCVISENTHDYPPRQPDGRYLFEGVEYLGAESFLARLADGVE